MFHVLGNDELTRVHRGLKFKDMSTISLNQYGEYVADEDMEFNLKKDDNGVYTLTLNNGSTILYKTTSSRKATEESVSFLNTENLQLQIFQRDGGQGV